MADALILPIGLVTAGLVAARLGVLTIAAWQQATYRREQDRLTLEVMRERIAEAKKRRNENALAWNGLRKFVVKRKVLEAEGICSFYLVAHDRKPLPPFKPGQYLTFRLSIPGRDKPVIRCYSLSDSPRTDQYRVSIKRVGSPPDQPTAPPGLVSNYFHEQLSEGDILDVQAPRGHFFLDVEQERPVVLIAGGVGVTPLLSMVNAVVATRTQRDVLFFYGVRNSREHAFKDTLQEIVSHHSNIRLVVAYSNPQPEDERNEGRDFHHSGRVDIRLIKSYLDSTNYQFYICGPPAMMETLNKQLLRWGVAEHDIHTEAFGPATVSKAFASPQAPQSARASDSAATAISITFAKSGKTCSWSPSAGNLLDLAEAHGVRIDSGCRAGNCGTCVVAVKSGKIQYVTEHGAELEEGTCLTCIAAPEGNIVLDA
ncbi:MAG: 2Fe-2S iron-sulfur cluster binding domain-containing protein [Planctomycetaceae bacterium]|nr:2Fe-2S iron-sulfur cluster binding domain-containing protein [Planctomycetales bacterium]MCB9940843.1 2Fe-2S iron-sulfur cluster binding domain-containing protein [Planctomycetaceae bacterium]